MAQPTYQTTTRSAKIGLLAESVEQADAIRDRRSAEQRIAIEAQVARERAHLQKIVAILHVDAPKWDTAPSADGAPTVVNGVIQPTPAFPHPVLVVDGIRFMSNNGREPDIMVSIPCPGGKRWHSGKVRSDVDRDFLVRDLGSILDAQGCVGECHEVLSGGSKAPNPESV